MDHLSGLDATFLYLETPEQPMHVGGLNIFELPAGYDSDFVEDLRTHITQRMHLAPVFDGTKLQRFAGFRPDRLPQSHA